MDNLGFSLEGEVPGPSKLFKSRSSPGNPNLRRARLGRARLAEACGRARSWTLLGRPKSGPIPGLGPGRGAGSLSREQRCRHGCCFSNSPPVYASFCSSAYRRIGPRQGVGRAGPGGLARGPAVLEFWVWLPSRRRVALGSPALPRAGAENGLVVRGLRQRCARGEERQVRMAGEGWTRRGSCGQGQHPLSPTVDTPPRESGEGGTVPSPRISVVFHWEEGRIRGWWGAELAGVLGCRLCSAASSLVLRRLSSQSVPGMQSAAWERERRGRPLAPESGFRPPVGHQNGPG